MCAIANSKCRLELFHFTKQIGREGGEEDGGG